MKSSSTLAGARGTTASISPLRIALLVTLGQVAVYAVTSIVTRSGGFHWGMYTVGDDWSQFFYPVAGRWLATGSPYGGNFLGPPTAALPAVLLHGFSPAASHAIYNLVTIPLMAFALWRFAASLGLRARNRWGLLAVAAMFLPTWLLINGANLDGLMLAGLLLAYSVRSRAGRAALLAGTVVLKVYSALLVVVALRKRELRFAGLTVAFGVLALLPFWRLWPEALGHVLFRAGAVGGIYNYNISPGAVFHLAFHGAGALAWEVAYAAFWLGTFAYTLARSRDRSEPETLATYAPFMIAAPMMVSAYVGVIALPAFALLLRVSQDRRLRWYEWMGVAGFLLLNLHPEFVVAYGSYTFAEFTTAKVVASLLSSAGTTLLVGATVARARAEGGAEGEGTVAAVAG